jgi:hypothetical protein
MSSDFSLGAQGAPSPFFADRAALVITRYEAEFNALPLLGQPNRWWLDDVWEKPGGGSQTTRFYIPVHSFAPQPWTGSVQLRGTSSVFFDVTRSPFTDGVYADVMKLAEMDFDAFDRTPTSLGIAIDKMPQVAYANLINNAFTTKDPWDGGNIAAITATKKVCPGRPKLGKWLNAYQNVSFTNPTDIRTLVTNVRGRLGFDGLPLSDGGGTWMPREMLVSTNNIEQAEEFLEVMQFIPETLNSATGGGNTNAFYKRLKPVEVPGMRDDMWIIRAKPPYPWLKPFAYVKGGDLSSYKINIDPTQSGSGVPHIFTIPFLQDSEMYRKHLRMGMAYVINEGYGWNSPWAYAFGYTGSAS